MKSATTLFFAVLSLVLSGCKFDKPMSVKLIHLNDTHSQFDQQITPIGLPNAQGQPTLTYAYVGGYPLLKTYIDHLREKAVEQNRASLLVHGGDAFSGSLFFTFYRGQLNADFMNYFDFDVMALGNHEFDLGNQELADFADKLNFPLISANTVVKPSDPFWGKYASAEIRMIQGQPLAIVGLTTEQSEIISSPSDNTTFLNYIETAKKAVKKLRAVGIEKVVFLTHIGLDADISLAEQVDGVDVILGGHSQELFGDHRNVGLPKGLASPLLINGPTGKPVCIMHSLEYSKGVAEIDVDFDGAGDVTNCQAQNTFVVADIFAQGTPPGPVDSATHEAIRQYIASQPNLAIVQADVGAQNILDQAKYEVAEFANVEIGTTSEPLYHVRLPGDTASNGQTLSQGSMVGPHVAKSMSDKLTSTSGDLYYGIINAGGIRSDLNGSLSVGTAYTTLPFDSKLVSLKLSGQQLLTLLDTNIKNAYAISGVAFPYVSNLRVQIDVDSQGIPTVSSILALDDDGFYSPLDPNFMYGIVTTSYLYGGGDLYDFSAAEDAINTGFVDADVLVDYVKRQSVLNTLDQTIIVNTL
jgi:5'-nucleotidase